jgi:hypothetical protein
VEQLNLRTGQAARFSLPTNATPVGYTRPSGLQVLGLPAGASVAVVTALGPQLLIHGLGCALGGQLVWFNPATKAEKWLFKTGAESVVPYYSTENSTFR